MLFCFKNVFSRKKPKTVENHCYRVCVYRNVLLFELIFHFFLPVVHNLESILPNFDSFVFPISLLSLSACSIRKNFLYFEMTNSKKMEKIFVLRRKKFGRIDSWGKKFNTGGRWLAIML